MNMKTILALLGVMLFGAGIVMAITGATVTTQVKQTRWTQPLVAPTTNVTAIGGDVWYANLSGGNALTTRWAAFYGMVTGGLVLSDNTNQTAYVFQWNTWNASRGGVVCASKSSALTFATDTALTNASLDGLLGYTGFDDSAAKTFADAQNCYLNFSTGVTIATTAKATHLNGSFWTCAVNATGSTTEPAYCTNITSANNFKGQTVNYEVMVPVNQTSTPVYFYANLQ